VEEIACAAPFYGVPGKALADATKCTKPVQGHYGAEDNYKGFSDADTARQLDADLSTAGVEHEVFLYDGVGHAFMNATPAGVARKTALGQGAHDQAAVDLAWARLFAFFDKHLQH
jgi:carboxymethylenebutenolidase